MKSSKTWFITGASQGIGLKLVRQVLTKDGIAENKETTLSTDYTS